MSSHTHSHPDPQREPEKDVQDQEVEAESLAAAPAGAVHEVDYEAELAKLKDQALRAMAEAENTRRRLQKELEDTRKYAVASFAKEILGVSDNFQRALDSVPKEGANAETLPQLVTGVEATERQLQATLEKFGIKKIDPMGQMFDPNFHRVMMEQDDPSKEPGTITMVLQTGYMIHDRLLREALVAIAKGGVSKPSKQDPSAPHKVDTSA